MPVVAWARGSVFTGRHRIMLRRIISSVALLAFLTATVGIPLPQVDSGRSTKHADEDYPCRDHACGCLNAAMCRTQCCCFPKPSAPVSTCCSRRAKTRSPDAAVPAKDRRPVGLAINALGCRSGYSLWTALTVVFPSPAPAQEWSVSPSIARLAPLREHIASQSSPDPDTPPPRILPLNIAC